MNIKMRKIFKNLVVIPMVAVVFASGMNTYMANASGNYHDRYFSLTYEGDGSDVATEKAQKWDTTKTDLYNKFSPCGVHARVVVSGKNKSSGYVFCGAKQEVFISSGASAYDYVYVELSPATNSRASISGYWSPDSINFNRNYK